MNSLVTQKKYYKFQPRRRSATVIACVLVVLLLVGMLCVQTTQTLLIIRRSDTQRAKLHQVGELLELGRQVDWQSSPSGSFVISIPQAVKPDAEPELLTAEIEGPRGGTDVDSVERILVHYPLNDPGTVTAFWERKHD